jgi:hypothetical protein
MTARLRKLCLILAVFCVATGFSCTSGPVVDVHMTGGSYWEKKELRIRLEAGSFQREFQQTQLLPRQNGGLTTGEVPVPTNGPSTVEVHFALTDTNGALLSSGSIELPLQHDWIWSVELRPGDTEDPLASCNGCYGAKSFPLVPDGPEGARRFWAIWGGNSISAPVVY